jgi:7-alpha-hydroxysteroid dehydrogenase
MILDRFRMDGKVAVVTGAGRGIGEGIALALGEMGADVVCAARSREPIEGVAGKVRGLGRRALAVSCDVNERAQLEELVARSVKELGRIDVLVNNAGGTPPQPVLRTSERMFENAFRFNVTSAFLLSRLVVPHMLEGGGGAILNISSAMSWVVDRGFVAYGTAKAALSHMTRLLGYELAPRVRVNAIAVGSVETAALAPFLGGGVRERMESLTPLRRLGSVEDIALAALYLASPASSFVTGKVFEVDGGLAATSNMPLGLPDL